jgi:hypothetical protein
MKIQWASTALLLIKFRSCPDAVRPAEKWRSAMRICATSKGGDLSFVWMNTPNIV